MAVVPVQPNRQAMKKEVLKKLTATPGKKHEVRDFDEDYTAGMKKEAAAALLQKNVETMTQLQERLYADDRHAVLVVFQAMDAAGKDGTIEHVMSGVNPQGCQVFSYKRPSSEELDHGYLWRIQKNVPERGRIGIFNRSHYEDVLVSRVHPELLLGAQIPGVNDVNDADEAFWERRYRQINDFERYLTETGTTVVKFFLNVSKRKRSTGSSRLPTSRSATCGMTIWTLTPRCSPTPRPSTPRGMSYPPTTSGSCAMPWAASSIGDWKN